MLGSLVKWLRILGYDTLYCKDYNEKFIEKQIKDENRFFLTRSSKAFIRHKKGIHLRSERLRDQLRQLVEAGVIRADPGQCFRLCLICNESLVEVDRESARDRIPEYVFHQQVDIIRKCPLCGRFYWQGSHRGRMLQQLKEWGILGQTNCSFPMTENNGWH